MAINLNPIQIQNDFTSISKKSILMNTFLHEKHMSESRNQLNVNASCSSRLFNPTQVVFASISLSELKDKMSAKKNPKKVKL